MTDETPTPTDLDSLPPLCDDNTTYHVRGYMINLLHRTAERHGYFTAKAEDSAERVRWIRNMWWKVWGLGVLCGLLFGFSFTLQLVKTGLVTP